MLLFFQLVHKLDLSNLATSEDILTTLSGSADASTLRHRNSSSRQTGGISSQLGCQNGQKSARLASQVGQIRDFSDHILV